MSVWAVACSRRDAHAHDCLKQLFSSGPLRGIIIVRLFLQANCKMKVIGIVLVLCLAGAMSQTMAPTQLECFLANDVEIDQLGDGCLAMMTSFLPVSHTALHS